MFKKKPNIKPLAPLRSSDRRKTADQIISDLHLLEVDAVPVNNGNNGNNGRGEGVDGGTAAANVEGKLEAGGNAEIDAEVAAKAEAAAKHTALRSFLLPDNALSARFTTTAGPNLRQQSGTLYVGAHPGEEQRVLWARTDARMFPTVYTLWHNPAILPLLHTPSIVIVRIRSGADLMTPGLAGGPPFPRAAKKGALVAIASTEAPSVPVAVGTCEIDVSALGRVQGSKGHAVRILHWAGDELWAWSASGKPGGAPPASVEGWLGGRDGEAEVRNGGTGLGGDGLANGMAELGVGDGDDGEGDDDGGGGVPVDGGMVGEDGANAGKKKAAELESEEDEVDPPVQEKELSTKEIDDAFYNAFLYGVHHHKNTNKAATNYGLQFPLSQSFILSNLVLPFLPAFTPTQTNALQIKKTSWKNVKKFVKALDKETLVKSKDKDGNEVAIWDINFEHETFVQFSPYRLPKKATAAGTGQGRGGKATTVTKATGTASSDPAVGQALRRIELFKPKEKLAPLFNQVTNSSTGSSSNKNKNSSSSSKSPSGNSLPRTYYTAADLRPAVTAYVEREQLINAKNRRLITLDPVLANAVFDGKQPSDAAVLAADSVARDALFERVQRACMPHWLVLRESDGKSLAERIDRADKPRPGTPANITLTLETRSGNKTVTKVSGLEAYHVPPQPLADELRKACASSTSVERSLASTAKNPVVEVMVQGPQREAVTRALEKRGVRRQWVEVVDRTKGKRRG